MPGTNSPSDLPGRSAHFPALDGLRGIAVLMVLYWHFIGSDMAAPAGTLAGYLFKLTHHAHSGVDLFFVLSGFLIARILLYENGTPRWLARFWIRRTFRILPVYFLFLAVSIAVALLQSGREAAHSLDQLPRPLWPYFVMLQNFQMVWADSFGPWGHLWSLAVEEQFYLVFPFVLLVPSVRRWLPGVALAAIVLSTILRMNASELSGYVLPQCRLDGLAMGACLGSLSVRERSWTWIAQRPAFVRSGTLLGLAGLAAITLRSQHRHPIDHTVFALSYGALLLDVVAFPASRLARVLSVRSLMFLGVISYPLYLFHSLCEWLVVGSKGVELPPTTYLSFGLVTTPLSIVVAWAINRWFGDPFLAWGRRLATRLRSTESAVPLAIGEVYAK